jgi:hypothetical protein
MCLWLAGTAGKISAESVNFDTSADLGLFSLNGGATTLFTYGSSAGSGATGGVVSTSTSPDTDAAVYGKNFDNPIGFHLYAQIDYTMHYQSTGPDVRIGFVTSAGGAFDFNDQIWAETFGAGNPKTIAYSADGSWNTLTDVSMSEGNWFRLRLDLTKTSASDYNTTITLSDLGATGTSAPSVLALSSFSINAPLFGAATQLHAAFFVMNTGNAVDNLVVPDAVPEPSGACLVLAAAAAGMLGARRRAAA